MEGRNPTWSPGGDSIAFDLNGALYVMGIADAVPTRLPVSGVNHLPEWSPSGDRILFEHSRRGETPYAWLISADGTGDRKACDFLVEGAGCWSPRGDEYAWCKIDNNGGQLSVFDTLTCLREDLLHGWFDVRYPAWSPDGTEIAFWHWGNKERCRGVYCVDVTTKDARLLMKDGSYPSWSPDGETIVMSGPGNDSLSLQLWFYSTIDGSYLPWEEYVEGRHAWTR